MIYVPRVPASPLSEFVETIFHLKDYQPEHSVERIVPDASSNIVIELDEQVRWVIQNETEERIQECRGSWVSGPHRHHFRISALNNSELVAIRFRPAGMYSLLKVPASEWANRVVSGEGLLKNGLVGLREELLSFDDSTQKLDHVENWLNQKIDFSLRPPREIQRAIQSIIEDPTIRNLATIVKRSGYSHKQFVFLFKKHLGLLPKEFQRVLRFTQVMNAIQAEQRVDWATLSIDCGYSDQPHFIKDFKQFSGFNPVEFVESNSTRTNFFPVDND